jgi:hypothetical protein
VERLTLEEKVALLTLTERAFSGWNSELGDWTIIPAAHKVAVGTSSRDLHLTTTLTRSHRPEGDAGVSE